MLAPAKPHLTQLTLQESPLSFHFREKFKAKKSIGLKVLWTLSSSGFPWVYGPTLETPLLSSIGPRICVLPFCHQDWMVSSYSYTIVRLLICPPSWCSSIDAAAGSWGQSPAEVGSQCPHTHPAPPHPRLCSVIERDKLAAGTGK